MGARGFTLVETLVALTLLALVASLMFGGLRFGARGWDAAAARTEARAETAAIRGFLQARLGAAAGPASEEETLGGVAGGAGAISFLAPWTTGPGAPGLYRFDLALVGEDLTLKWRRAGQTEAGSRALLSGVAALRIGYFGAPSPGGRDIWRDSWPEGRRSPDLVRIDLAFADPDRSWRPLVARRRF